MIGKVDENFRSLVCVRIRHSSNSTPTELEAWVDTAFDGHFVFSNELIEDLQLDTLVETDAILADGTQVTMQTFLAYLDWFGEWIPVQVIANSGQFPLLGTNLLHHHRLTIDFAAKTVKIEAR